MYISITFEKRASIVGDGHEEKKERIVVMA